MAYDLDELMDLERGEKPPDAWGSIGTVMKTIVRARIYFLGETYETLSGKRLEIIDFGVVVGYECVQCSDGKWRYDRPGDRGRLTGSHSDDPDCLVNHTEIK